MKLAAGLFGIHYKLNYNHWCFGNTNINYQRVLANNHEFLWSSPDIMSIDYYGVTYNSTVIDQLVADYNFKYLSRVEMQNDLSSMIYRNQRFRELLNLIHPYYDNYDWVLITRFDLRFIDKPLSKDISHNHVNLLHRAKWGDDDTICDDNFYLIPKSKWKEFYNFINELSVEIHSHYYNHHYRDFYYIIDRPFYSHENPIYMIDRF